MTLTAKLVLGAIVFFAVGVVARIVQLQRRSREIEKTLDYSKMTEWEEDD